MLGASPTQRGAACLAVVGCLAAVLGAAAPVRRAAHQAPEGAPVRAAVYIRLFGDLVLTRPADAFQPERRFEASDVEVSTGSGVLISSTGHVLTAAHVVMPGSETTWKIEGVPVAVKRTVRRVEVMLPPDEGAPALPPFPATVLATDGGLDLAVLSVGGSNLPFLDLGDSDAVGVGDPLEAVGFPFGNEVEIGKASVGVAAPAPSISRGNLAAVRGDEQYDRRYLQVTAALNPGNSGGPIVDADGYLLAIATSVMRSRAGVGAGVGFGVPVNLVKRFLENNGLDSVLRARRLAAAGLSPLEGKGVRVALPIGMSDASPYRSQVDTSQQPDGLAFRADRFVSPWSLARLESALLSSRGLEPFVPSNVPVSQIVDTPGGRVLIGRVTGSVLATTGADGGAASGTPTRMDYAIAERGGERVVARFIGPPYQLAYNASFLRNVLRQMEVDALRQPSSRLQAVAAWIARSAPRGTPLDQVSLPSGWLLEPAGPLACADLPAPADVVSASPAGDFAVALRAGWIASATTPQAAAASCGTPGGDDRTSYTREFAFLGTSYVLEGRFAAVPGQGLLQMEGTALANQAATMRALFAAWPPPTTPPAFRSR